MMSTSVEKTAYTEIPFLFFSFLFKFCPLVWALNTKQIQAQLHKKTLLSCLWSSIPCHQQTTFFLRGNPRTASVYTADSSGTLASDPDVREMKLALVEISSYKNEYFFFLL